MTQADLFAGLLHQTSAGPLPDLDPYRAARVRPDGDALGAVVVPDDRLAALGEPLDGVHLSVLVGSGAGGLTALARRTRSLPVVAAETVLRDLDDLAANAARVVAAARELPEEVEVFVGVPTGRGTVDAVETVEAAGLRGRVDLAARDAVTLLGLLVETDLPFKATGTGIDPFGPYGVAGLLMAVEALVDGADPDEVGPLLTAVDHGRAVAALIAWDDATRARVRRRLRAVDCADAGSTLDALAGAGLLSGS